MSSQSHQPYVFKDIFLQPGEFYFGDRNTRIRTLLGSCVAITLWHPRLKIGGMCHYLLPIRRGLLQSSESAARYADDAIKLFMDELDQTRTWSRDYEVKMFGGGDQFPEHHNTGIERVHNSNVEIGRHLLTQYGFIINAEHLGGTGHRNIIFDVWSGQVWVQHVAKS